jgi:hypothetical protein
MADYFKPQMSWLEKQNKGSPDRLGIKLSVPAREAHCRT